MSLCHFFFSALDCYRDNYRYRNGLYYRLWSRLWFGSFRRFRDFLWFIFRFSCIGIHHHYVWCAL